MNSDEPADITSSEFACTDCGVSAESYGEFEHRPHCVTQRPIRTGGGNNWLLLTAFLSAAFAIGVMHFAI